MNLPTIIRDRSRWTAAIMLVLAGVFGWKPVQAAEAGKPNIVLVLLDNVGWGEFGCYGGGVLRGSPTPNIDRLAAEGLRLTDFNVATTCMPTRSGLLTGRFAIRDGTVDSGASGLVAWDVTLSELLKKQGYATALFGKWGVGSGPGRYPTDFGFDEWYGIPRSTGESLNQLSPGYDPKVTPPEYIMEGTAGTRSRKVEVYGIAARRQIDLDLTAKAIAFATREVAAKKPFFLYVPLTQVHYPTLPSKEFAAKTGFGDFADSMVQTDYLIGEMVRAIDHLGIGRNTLIIVTSDNGAEYRRPWRGTAGPWSGTYHTIMEGGIRVPAILRWTGVIKPRVSNDVVHIVDLFTTLAHLGGAQIPSDRPIDGVDQWAFFTGKVGSARQGFPIYNHGELFGVKWRNWKYDIIWQPHAEQPAIKLVRPYIFNLIVDPKEQSPRDYSDDTMHYEDDWIMKPIDKIIDDMSASLAECPPIPYGAPVNYVPKPCRPKPHAAYPTRRAGPATPGPVL